MAEEVAMQGQPLAAEAHISSLVVHSLPGRTSAIADTLAALPGIEVHGGVEAGKLVVTLETDSEFAIVERLNLIQRLDGVLAATLVFHHFEPAAPADPTLHHRDMEPAARADTTPHRQDFEPAAPADPTPRDRG